MVFDAGAGGLPQIIPPQAGWVLDLQRILMQARMIIEPEVREIAIHKGNLILSAAPPDFTGDAPQFFQVRFAIGTSKMMQLKTPVFVAVEGIGSDCPQQKMIRLDSLTKTGKEQAGKGKMCADTGHCFTSQN
jgi:hypothetical protein